MVLVSSIPVGISGNAVLIPLLLGVSDIGRFGTRVALIETVETHKSEGQLKYERSEDNRKRSFTRANQ